MEIISNIINFILITLISIALLVYSVPTDFYRFRGVPSEDSNLMNPTAAEKWEEFRINITNRKQEKSLLSCLEDQTYSAINDFANCHLFCPLCYQGYGRCESTGDLRLCICDCNFFGEFMQNVECPWVTKLCSRVAESKEQYKKLINCQTECQERGFADAALCGAEMEDPPLVRSTCTCLCP